MGVVPKREQAARKRPKPLYLVKKRSILDEQFQDSKLLEYEMKLPVVYRLLKSYCLRSWHWVDSSNFPTSMDIDSIAKPDSLS